MTKTKYTKGIVKEKRTYTKAQLFDLCKAQTDQLVQLKLTLDLFSEQYGYLLGVILDEYPQKDDLHTFLRNHPDPQVVGMIDQIIQSWAKRD